MTSHIGCDEVAYWLRWRCVLFIASLSRKTWGKGLQTSMKLAQHFNPCSGMFGATANIDLDPHSQQYHVVPSSMQLLRASLSWHKLRIVIQFRVSNGCDNTRANTLPTSDGQCKIPQIQSLWTYCSTWLLFWPHCLAPRYPQCITKSQKPMEPILDSFAARSSTQLQGFQLKSLSVTWPQVVPPSSADPGELDQGHGVRAQRWCRGNS